MERICIKDRHDIVGLSSCKNKYPGNHTALGNWDPGLGSEMRGQDWPTQTVTNGAKGKIASLGKAGSSKQVPLKCEAKGSGQRGRNNQVLGKSTRGESSRTRQAVFWTTGGRQSLGVSQAVEYYLKRIFMGAIRVLSWFYIYRNIMGPSP